MDDLDTMHYLEQWTEEIRLSKIKCCACNGQQEYVVPAFCEDHYKMWLTNRDEFERMYYNGLEA